MPFPAPGTAPGEQMLDGPPPSPGFESGMSTGQPAGAPGQPGPLGSLVPQLNSAGLPAEVMSGILSAGEKMSAALDSFAQITPDLAPDWAMAKDSLLNAMAKLIQRGATPSSTTSPGGNFTGGGLDRGGMPAASGI